MRLTERRIQTVRLRIKKRIKLVARQTFRTVPIRKRQPSVDSRTCNPFRIARRR